jgi:hypothetical protein
VAPNDVLHVVNEINANGPRHVIASLAEGEPGRTYPDTNGDDFVSALDALLVINDLNGQAAGAAEGEFSPDTARQIRQEAPDNQPLVLALVLPQARRADTHPAKPARTAAAAWPMVPSLDAHSGRPAATAANTAARTERVLKDQPVLPLFEEDLLALLAEDVSGR